jgi:hypothetical protein
LARKRIATTGCIGRLPAIASAIDHERVPAMQAHLTTLSRNRLAVVRTTE